MKNNKKIYLLAAAIIFSLVLGGFILAQEKPLETQYPQLPGAQTPNEIRSLPQYVKYVFSLSIWIAGFLAFATTIYGGVKFLTSGGSPSAMSDAREQIFAGILGLIIIVSAYTILANVNPQLVVLREPGAPIPASGDIPGVYLCRSASQDSDNCVVYNRTLNVIDPNFEDQIQYVYLKNATSSSFAYGTVLHQNQGRQGNCKIILENQAVQMPGGVSSVTVFRRGAASGEGVSLYEYKYYNEDCGDCERSPDSGGYQDVWQYNLDREGRSIKITPEDKYLVALFENTDSAGECEVFTRSDPDLASNPIGICGRTSNLGCFHTVTVLPIE